MGTWLYNTILCDIVSHGLMQVPRRMGVGRMDLVHDGAPAEGRHLSFLHLLRAVARATRNDKDLP